MVELPTSNFHNLIPIKPGHGVCTYICNNQLKPYAAIYKQHNTLQKLLEAYAIQYFKLLAPTFIQICLQVFIKSLYFMVSKPLLVSP